MAKLTRPKFLVFLSEDDEGTEVSITWGDQLRAEMEAAKQGIKAAQGQGLHLTTVWCWCAMVRAHGYEGHFQEFKRQVSDHGGIESGDEAETVDPTQPATMP